MNYVAPIFDHFNAVIGVLTTWFNWDYVYDIIDEVIIDDQSEFYLINKDGILIASKKWEEILYKDFGPLTAVQLLKQGKATIGYQHETSGRKTEYNRLLQNKRIHKRFRDSL